MFGEIFIREKLIVSGDAAATATNLASIEPLWRFGIAAELVLGKRLRIAALLGGEAGKLGLHVGAEMYFHRLQSRDSRAVRQPWIALRYE